MSPWLATGRVGLLRLVVPLSAVGPVGFTRGVVFLDHFGNHNRHDYGGNQADTEEDCGVLPTDVDVGDLQIHFMLSIAEDRAEIEAKQGQKTRAENPGKEEGELRFVFVKRLWKHSRYFALPRVRFACFPTEKRNGRLLPDRNG